MDRPINIENQNQILRDIKNCQKVFKNGRLVGNISKCLNYCSHFNILKNSSVMEGNLKFMEAAIERIDKYIEEY